MKLMKLFLYAVLGWLVVRNYQPNTPFTQTVHVR